MKIDIKTHFLIFLAMLFFSTNLHAVDESFTADIFSTKDAIILGITQGITEYLPVSSTGHMLIIEKHLSEKKSEIFSGDAGTIKKASVKRAKDSYFAIIQAGSVLAVLVLYRRRIFSIFSGLRVPNSDGRKLLINLMFSFIPSAVIGVIIDGHVQKFLYRESTVAVALIIGSLIIILAEMKYSPRRGHEKNHNRIEDLTIFQSLKIGLWQCLSLIPGMSRSMTTIVGGYLCKLRRSEAAEYSFILGCATLTGATFFKFVRDFDIIFSHFSLKTFSLGIITAFIFSMLGVKVLVTFISKHGLSIFAVYRIILATVLFYYLIYPAF